VTGDRGDEVAAGAEPVPLDVRVLSIAARQLAAHPRLGDDEDRALEPTWRESRWDQIPNRFRWARADRLDEDVAKEVTAWAGSPGPLPNLVLYGSVGTGKTFAAVAAARLRFDAGDEVAFWPVVELLDGLRPGGDLEVWDQAVYDAQVLILDDLGASRATDWTDERLYALVNRRWLDERPTIVTTNIDPGQLAVALGERMASRILGAPAVVYGLNGPDRRLT
jgi:DNA replication protein DnaC